jgi:hypothetical protein
MKMVRKIALGDLNIGQLQDLTVTLSFQEREFLLLVREGKDEVNYYYSSLSAHL